MSKRASVRRQPLWPWLLGITLFTIAIALIIVNFPRNEERADINQRAESVAPVGAGDERAPARTAREVPAAVAAFAGFVTQEPVGREHDYTTEGLRRLDAAIESLSRSDSPADPTVNPAGDTTDARVDIVSAGDATEVRNAFHEAVAELAAVARQRRADNLMMAINELEQIAGNLNPDRPVRDQVATVQLFFQRAATVTGALATVSGSPE